MNLTLFRARYLCAYRSMIPEVTRLPLVALFFLPPMLHFFGLFCSLYYGQLEVLPALVGFVVGIPLAIAGLVGFKDGKQAWHYAFLGFYPLQYGVSTLSDDYIMGFTSVMSYIVGICALAVLACVALIAFCSAAKVKLR